MTHQNFGKSKNSPPDKVADQISDALLDQFLAYDDKAPHPSRHVTI
ncbi:MAG: hypothetical protein J5548_15585 [Prevotella sp.]|nr:hypothetical protein [Prevotella sp.]